MQETGITISGLAKTNTNWHHNNIKKTITSTISEIFPHYSVVFSANHFHPPDPSPYLPGGCMQVCTGHWTGKILSTIHDKKCMSRWIGHKYRLKGPKTLSVITAYRPCRQPTSTNEQLITVNYQQKSLIYDDTGEE
jgi:hypothetical protein